MAIDALEAPPRRLSHAQFHYKPSQSLTREQRLYKESLRGLTPIQTEIAYGMLLGDASIRIHPNCRYPAIKFDQNLRQAAFVEDLFKVFRDWTWYREPSLTTYHRTTDAGPVTYRALYFCTFSHPAFLPLYHAFFSRDGVLGPKKVIPENVEAWLSPRVLAYHVMCDGSIGDRKLRLHTHGFTKEDSQRYIDGLHRTFGLSPYIAKDQRGKVVYWRIMFRTKDLPLLQSLLSPYMLPSMGYKLLLPEALDAPRSP